MNSFITRVELHGANWQDYENLHSYMAAARFYRTIKGDDGVIYQLPTATYSSHGNLSAREVRELAMSTAARTGRRAWVLVTETKSNYWQLQPISPHPVANALAALPRW
jgi:hypothetical protein